MVDDFGSKVLQEKLSNIFYLYLLTGLFVYGIELEIIDAVLLQFDALEFVEPTHPDHLDDELQLEVLFEFSFFEQLQILGDQAEQIFVVEEDDVVSHFEESLVEETTFTETFAVFLDQRKCFVGPVQESGVGHDPIVIGSEFVNWGRHTLVAYVCDKDYRLKCFGFFCKRFRGHP